MKFAVVLLATAFTSIVLPVPGGPYSRTPRGGSIPSEDQQKSGNREHYTPTDLLVEVKMR